MCACTVSVRPHTYVFAQNCIKPIRRYAKNCVTLHFGRILRSNITTHAHREYKSTPTPSPPVNPTDIPFLWHFLEGNVGKNFSTIFYDLLYSLPQLLLNSIIADVFVLGQNVLSITLNLVLFWKQINILVSTENKTTHSNILQQLVAYIEKLQLLWKYRLNSNYSFVITPLGPTFSSLFDKQSYVTLKTDLRAKECNELRKICFRRVLQNIVRHCNIKQ